MIVDSLKQSEAFAMLDWSKAAPKGFLDNSDGRFVVVLIPTKPYVPKEVKNNEKSRGKKAKE